jgi:hypothetical protein
MVSDETIGIQSFGFRIGDRIEQQIRLTLVGAPINSDRHPNKSNRAATDKKRQTRLDCNDLWLHDLKKEA